MAIIVLFLSLLNPILSCIISFTALLISNKNKKIYSLSFAFSLGIIAYIWVPAENFDLFRWHNQMINLSRYTYSDFIKFAIENFEIINYSIKYYIGLTGDYNLVQFLIAFIGYYEILWMISDYKNQNEIKNSSFCLITIFILLSLGYIDYISGLWFNFAIINFSLGIYFKTFRKTKFLHNIFFTISLLTHITTIFLFIIYIINNLTKKEKPLKTYILLFLSFSLCGTFLSILAAKLNIPLFDNLNHLYEVYFLGSENYDYLHGGIILFLALYRFAICIIITILNKNNKFYQTKYKNYIIMTIISIIAMLINATIFIRFIFFIQLISIPIMMDYFNKKRITKNQVLIITILAILSALLTYKQYVSLKSANIFENINENMLKSAFNLKSNKR